jgi:hypothetical protein
VRVVAYTQGGHRLILQDDQVTKEKSTMTAPHSLPFAAMPEENLAWASPDLLRQMVKTFAEAMMRRVGGRPGRLRRETSAWRRRMRSRCHLRIVSGETTRCSCEFFASLFGRYDVTTPPAPER